MAHVSTVSVAMATYNGERYLESQLDSILQQSCPPKEIIICDDGSTDTTRYILNKYAGAFPKTIRYYANPRRLGFVRNFERSVGLCTGDIIALSDQDDIWFPNRLQEILNCLDTQTQVGMTFCDAQVVNAELGVIGDSLYAGRFVVSGSPKTTIPNLIRKVDIKGCTMAFRSEYRKFILPFPEIGWGHDHWVAFVLSAFSDVQFLSEPLMMYRRHSQNHGFDPKYKGFQNHLKWLRLIMSLEVYQEDYQKWNAALAHLESLRDDFSEIPVEAISESIEWVRQRLEFAEARLAMRRSGRLSRTYPALKLWSNGGYRAYARGQRTLIRDLIA